MNRRGFFATLTAVFAARFAPKPKAPSIGMFNPRQDLYSQYHWGPGWDAVLCNPRKIGDTITVKRPERFCAGAGFSKIDTK